MKKVCARDEKGFNCDGKRKKYVGGARKAQCPALKSQRFVVSYPYLAGHGSALPAACKGERRHPLSGSLKKPMAVI